MIFLDVDGVICNWNLGFCKLAKIKMPDDEYLDWDWAKVAVAPRSIWSYKMDSFFWSELPKYSYADELIRIIENYDKDFRFLTSSPLEPSFHSGRARWIERNFGKKYLEKLIICSVDKSFCANGNFLIDDKEKNVIDWLNNGGRAFRWKVYNDSKGKGMAQVYDCEREFKNIEFGSYTY